MTTIATDGKSIAADGMRNTAGSITKTDDNKLTILEDGRIFAACGDTQDSYLAIAWFNVGGERPKLNDNFKALVLSKDGVLCYEDALIGYPIGMPCAIGSGMDFAVGAMDAGASPLVAVEIACKRDIYSGGAVRVLSI